MARAELHNTLDALSGADPPAAEEALRRLGDVAGLQALEQAALDDQPDDREGQLTEARRDAAERLEVATDGLSRRLRLRVAAVRHLGKRAELLPPWGGACEDSIELPRQTRSSGRESAPRRDHRRPRRPPSREEARVH
jgi:hypothetical protein